MTGGRLTADPQTGKGWFFEPTIIDAAPADDAVVQQEIFGPVLVVQSFETEEEALALANGTTMGWSPGSIPAISPLPIAFTATSMPCRWC
nr:aldehyde dehydrogenase family protein [Rhizobium sp. CG5]